MTNKWLIFLGLWLLLTLLEKLFPANRAQPVISPHLFTEGLCLFVNKLLLGPALAALKMVMLLMVMEPFVPRLPLAETISAWPFALKFIAAVFFVDLAQYLRHRLTHAFIWSCHATHHSAVELRASVHWRLHPVDVVFISLLDTAFLFVLGFPVKIIIAAQIFMSLHNMWLHANLDMDYGPLRRIFVSPNYHKWHHAKEKAAIDRNFADLFVFLDVLGGTHYYPHDRRPDEYGVHGVSSDAPLHRHYIGAMLYPLTQVKEWAQQKKMLKKA